MIVEVLEDKYRCGSNVGMIKEDKPGILEDLNKVIEWEHSTLPDGVEKKLEPGSMFIYEGQVIGVDNPDRLILCISETGWGALHRFTTTILDIEKLFLSETGIENLKIISDSKEDLKEEYRIPWYLFKAWKERVIPGRYPDDWKSIRVSFESEYSIFPVTVEITAAGSMMYSEDMIPSDIIDEISEKVLAEVVKLLPRINK